MLMFGLRVDSSYKSKVQITDMNMKETCAEFYKRMYNITRLLIREVGGAGWGRVGQGRGEWLCGESHWTTIVTLQV